MRRAWSAFAGLILLGGSWAGCSRGAADADAGAPSASAAASGSAQAGTATAPASFAASTPLVEQREDGSLSWIVLSDGNVRLTVRDGSGKLVLPSELEATLTVRDASSTMWAEGDLLAGAIGTLEDELTDFAYVVKVRGTSWTGLLQLPATGTDALVRASAVSVPAGTRGPNGGLVDVVGEQRVELVADAESGELRVYLLDERLQVMPVGDAELTVGIQE
jgi:hypothetical protein